MSKFVIEGGRSLSGRIEPQGSKNAALPILFATILINGISTIDNLPDIGDVDIVLTILKELGAVITRDKERVSIDTRNIYYKIPDTSLIKKIRASTYLMGACLSRFGRAEIMDFGGCNFDVRPIDLHIYAAEKLGAELSNDTLTCKKLKGNEIKFTRASVGATINSIMMAVSAVGKTSIIGGAREPHVYALIDFLRSAGAIIKEDESGFYIDGSELRDAEIKIIPDTIEVGTYLYLAPLTCGDFSMDKSLSKELEVPLNCLRSGGIKISEEGDALKINGEITKSLCVETMPYPGYPTDLQPQIAPLMAKYCGGKIIENVWLGRFGYLRALEAFGVKYKQVDNSAVIYNSELKNGNTNAPDLRGGIACVMCALAAKGKSEVYSAEVIMRGYSSLVDKLRSLGADIRIE